MVERIRDILEGTSPADAVRISGPRTLDQAGAEASALATLEATIPLWTAPAGRATAATADDVTRRQPRAT